MDVSEFPGDEGGGVQDAAVNSASRVDAARFFAAMPTVTTNGRGEPLETFFQKGKQHRETVALLTTQIFQGR